MGRIAEGVMRCKADRISGLRCADPPYVLREPFPRVPLTPILVKIKTIS